MNVSTEHDDEMALRGADAWETLRAFALRFPGAHEDFPWGDSVAKVNKKVFVFLGRLPGPEDEWGMTVKLPHSSMGALQLHFARPASYGLARSGWVTMRFRPDEEVPVELLCDWITESYCAIAPKDLVSKIEEAQAP